jgi:predicted acetyltransferase
VRICPVPLAGKSPLRTLLTAYLDELAALEGVPPRPRDLDGHATYRWFDHYWTDPDRLPLGIWVGSDLAGFCLLRDTADRWQIAEFYVAPSQRRRGVATTAVAGIVGRCRASGTHRWLEASTLAWNEPALAFWRRQGFSTVSETAEHAINVRELSQRAV